MVRLRKSELLRRISYTMLSVPIFLLHLLVAFSQLDFHHPFLVNHDDGCKLAYEGYGDSAHMHSSRRWHSHDNGTPGFRTIQDMSQTVGESDPLPHRRSDRSHLRTRSTNTWLTIQSWLCVASSPHVTHLYPTTGLLTSPGLPVAGFNRCCWSASIMFVLGTSNFDSGGFVAFTAVWSASVIFTSSVDCSQLKLGLKMVSSGHFSEATSR